MSRLALALAALVVATACKDESTATTAPAVPEKKGPPAVTEAEPNNDTKSAQVLTAASAVKASFEAGAKADEDWIRFDAPTPVVLRAEASAVAGTETIIEVYNVDKDRIAKYTGTEADGAIVPNLTCTASCYLKVTPAKKDAAGDYTLTITTSVPGPRSEKEPNNRFVDAQDLAIGGAIDGFLGAPEDEDWFKLSTADLPADQVVSIAFASPPDVRAELAVLRLADQAPIGGWKASDLGQDIKVRNLSPAAAPETGYFLVVKSAWVSVAGQKGGKRLANPKIAYTLEVKAAPGVAGIETEPNDDAAHATVVDLAAGPRAGFLAPKGDADWFTFKLDAPAILRAEVTGVDRVNFVLSAIDPGKKSDEKDNELAKSDVGEVKEGEVLTGVALPAGENFVKVEGAWKKIDDKWVKDYENANDPYSLTLSLRPDDGTFEREPNNAADKATPLDVGRTFEGYIHPAKDVDTWRLEVAQTTNVALVLSAVPKLDLSLTVRDANRTGDKGEYAIVGTVDKNKIEAEERLVVPFEPGSYFIEVKEKGRESNALKSYTLSLK